MTTDRRRLDIEVVHGFLALHSYWASGIPRTTLEESIRNSLCFGLFHSTEQIGFARVISDFATFAYLGDVFVAPGFRGRGLSKWLLECVCSHPGLKDLRRWILVTGDAHGLYTKFGFTQLAHPENFMERHNPDVYKANG
ncbi:MAG: GNAT family N-acetyltransferase [Terracidiphilus sp.]